MSGSFESVQWNQCAQTRPRLILSSERVLGDWIQIPCYLQGKIPSIGKESFEEDRTHDAASSRTASPTHYQRAIPAPSPGPETHQHVAGTLTDSGPLTGSLVTANLVCGPYRLVGLVVKASSSGAEDPGFESRLRRDFSGSSHTSDLKLALQWLPCQASGITGSAPGLVGPVSVYNDWVKTKV